MDSKCIIPFVNCERGTPVDSEQVYLRENVRFEDKKVCRLCMQIINCSFTSLEVDVNLLRRYVPEIKFSGFKEAMCNDCKRKLNAALKFKSASLYTDKIIISHLDCNKMLQLDSAEVYMKENGNVHLTGISYKPKICRLCMQLINGDIRCIGEEEREAIHKFVPEMNISIIVVCKPCYDSMCTHNSFLKDFLERWQKITDIFESSASESQTDATPSGLMIRTENMVNESEVNKEEMLVKTECVDIKTEEDGEGSDILSLPFNRETFESSDRKDEEVEHQYMWRHKNRSVDKCGAETRVKNSFTFPQLKPDKSHYKCNKCVFETESKICFMSHYSEHIERYKCEICEYVTIWKHSFKNHILKHKDPSEIQMYKCDACDYESRYKSNFTKHQLIHKNAAEIKMYRCNKCNFKTKYRESLTKHTLLHRDPLYRQMYKCDVCDYESRYKNNFSKHQLIHKDVKVEVEYKCSECNFKTKYKKSITKHILLHRDPLYGQMYKCNACDYQSRHKGSFTRHRMTHVEVEMYKCNECNFETKYRNNLTNHMLLHRDPLRFM